MTERTAVYRFYDDVDRLLYVGITNNTEVRFAWHKANAGWWPDQRRVQVAWFSTRTEAAEVEYRAIRTEGPLWNRAHTKAAGRKPYAAPNSETSAEIEAVAQLHESWKQFEAEYRLLVAELTDQQGEWRVPVAHIADRIGVERKTVYRHTGRSMT